MANMSLYVTEEPGPSTSAEVDICVLEITKKYEVIPCLVCSICVVFGLIYCFLGYRCFKMVMFLSGFMFGSATVLLLYHKEPVLDTQLGMETKAGIGLGVGVLCGLVTMLVYTMGLFLTGLQLGSILTLACLVVIEQFYSLTPTWLPLSILLATCTVCGICTLLWQKLFTVISTAVFGATAVMVCVDYLVETFRFCSYLFDIFHQVPPRPLCWFSWAIAGIIPVFSLLGMLVQWNLSARGLYHKLAANKQQKKQAQTSQYRYRDSRRRRKPPPLKRYAGDVLAPSYLQSLRERQMGTGSSSSSLSTITHTVVDFDFDTGSTVPLTASPSVYRV